MNSKEKREAFVSFACAYTTGALAATAAAISKPPPKDLDDAAVTFARAMLKRLDSLEEKGTFVA